MKKLNCNQGNYQCGGKCQPNINECPTEIDSVTGGQIDTYTRNTLISPEKIIINFTTE